MPDHPDAPGWKLICDTYKQKSAELQEKRTQNLIAEAEEKVRERRLDSEFASRLRDIDMDDERLPDEPEDEAFSSQKRKRTN